MIGNVTLEQVAEMYEWAGIRKMAIFPWYEEGELVALVTGWTEWGGFGFLGENVGFLEHFIIKPQETTFRSFASGQTRRGMFTHRDLALRDRTRLTRVGGVDHSVTFYQSTILHEFGHTLGLHHVAGSGNGSAAYGTTLEQRLQNRLKLE